MNLMTSIQMKASQSKTQSQMTQNEGREMKNDFN